MQKKISTSLEVLLYPFRCIDFNHNEQFTQLATEKVAKKREKKLSSLITDVTYDLMHTIPIHSVDEVKLLLEKDYPFLFDEKPHKEEDIFQSYMKVLNQLSKSLIAHRDGKIVYKYWKNPNDRDCFGPYTSYQKIHIIQILFRLMPVDLLVSNYLLENQLDSVEQLHGYYSYILLADKPLEEKLKQGVSENHMHLGAGFNFSITWTLMMNLFGKSSEARKKSLEKYNARLSVKGDNKGHTILQASILRILLCLFLEQKSKTDSFEQWLSELEKKQSTKDFLRLIIQNKDIRQWIEEENVSCDELQIGRFEQVWEDITQNTIDYSEVKAFDYATELFGVPDAIRTYGENIFLFYALKYWKEHPEDTMYIKFFMKYIRIKNHIFSCIVQQGSSEVKGLDFFKNYYRKASGVMQFESSKEYYKTVFRTIFQDEFLKQVEVRISPDRLKTSVRNILKAYYEVINEDYNNGNQSFPLLGIVVHLLKRPDTKKLEKCWKMYDETERTEHRLSFGKIQETYKKDIETFSRLRNTCDYLPEFLVGLDAASGENDTPVCVFAPLFDNVRNSNSQKLISISDNGELIKNKTLNFTFHAGEDFRHVLSGLRRVDEVVEWCKFHAGDRIGHGTVLGTDIKKWAMENPVVVLPRGEYLENLIWVWACYTQDNYYEPEHVLYLESQINKYAEEIYQCVNGLTPVVLYEAYSKKFEFFQRQLDKNDTKETEEEQDIFCCEMKKYSNQSWDVERLVNAQHCICYMKQYYEPIQVGINETDIKIASSVQSIVKHKIASKGIIIEVNPSSNLAIGEMHTILEHQAFKLNQLSDKEKSSVMLNINSDDPAVFNTNVSNEIAYLYYGLLNQNVGREECLQWIDKIRDYGMQYSFVNSIDHQTYYKHLCKVLQALGET